MGVDTSNRINTRATITINNDHSMRIRVGILINNSTRLNMWHNMSIPINTKTVFNVNNTAKNAYAKNFFIQ